MKKIILLTCVLITSITIYAQSAFTEALNLYEQGKYVEAKQHFELSIKIGERINLDQANGCIKDCETQIAKIKARRQAQAQAKADEQARIKREEVKRNGYIYLTTHAYDLRGNKMTNFQGYVQGKRDGIEYTFIESEARYKTYVTVSPRLYNTQEANHIVIAEAEVVIEDVVENKEYSSSFSSRGGHPTSDYEATDIALEKLAVEVAQFISTTIAEKIYVEEPKSSKKTLAIYPYGVAKDKEKKIIVDVLTDLFVNNASNKYSIIETDSDVLKQLEKELNVQYSGTVDDKYIYDLCTNLGAEEIIALEVQGNPEEKDGYTFRARWITMNRAVIETASYPDFLKKEDELIIQSIDQLKLQYVGAELFLRLGVDTQNQGELIQRVNSLRGKISNAENENKSKQDAANKKKKIDNALRAFVPGCAQWYKYSRTKAGIIIATEALGVGGIVLGYSMKASNEKLMKQDPKHITQYSERADMWHNIGLGSIAFTAAIYVWNVIDAFVAPSNRPEYLAIVPTTYSNGGIGMMLSFKF